MVADLEQLLARFREVSGASDVRMTLAVRRTDACRKFHADDRVEAFANHPRTLTRLLIDLGRHDEPAARCSRW
jgi:Protein of unknown function (DUF1826)